jgi:hypothetical protein
MNRDSLTPKNDQPGSLWWDEASDFDFKFYKGDLSRFDSWLYQELQTKNWSVLQKRLIKFEKVNRHSWQGEVFVLFGKPV